MIFGMHDPCDMAFQLEPCGDLDFWPTTNKFVAGWGTILLIYLFRFEAIIAVANTALDHDDLESVKITKTQAITK